MVEKLNKPLAEGGSEITELTFTTADGRVIKYSNRNRSKEHRHDVLAFENVTVDAHPQVSDTNAD